MSNRLRRTLTEVAPPASGRLSESAFLLAGAAAGLLGWGAVNGTATALTLVGLAGLVPPKLAFWTAWVAAAAVGYCWTGTLLVPASWCSHSGPASTSVSCSDRRHYTYLPGNTSPL